MRKNKLWDITCPSLKGKKAIIFLLYSQIRCIGGNYLLFTNSYSGSFYEEKARHLNLPTVNPRKTLNTKLKRLFCITLLNS